MGNSKISAICFQTYLNSFILTVLTASILPKACTTNEMYGRLNYLLTSRKNKRPTFILISLFALKRHCSLTAVKLKIGMCMDEGSCQLPCESGIFTWNSYVTINEFLEIKNVP